MKKLIASLSLATLLAMPAVAQVGEIVPNENLIAEGIPKIPASIAADVARYTETRTAGLSSWHPLKREMLISTRFADTAQVHLVKFPGGARKQLTFFPDRVGGASFQPTKGEYFIFSKDIGGGEFFQLYRYDVADGAVTLLTDGKSRNSGGAWSKAGDRVAYSSTRRNGADTDIYVMNPLDPKTDRKVLEVKGGGWGVADWSADDKKLLVGEGISINESHLWLVDVATGEKTPLTPRDASEKVAYSGAKFSADGKGVYLATDKGSEFKRLVYVDLATKAEKVLTPNLNWDVEDFSLSEDGKHIAFESNEDGVSVLHVIDAKTGKEMKLPTLPKGTLGGLEWHRNGRELGFSLGSAKSPGDVYSIDITTGKLERWTESETGGLVTETLSEPDLVRWPSFDGKQISGFLYRPAKKFTGKRPVIINIHGGPEGQSRPGFIGRSNYFINELGVAVIFPNVRGSSGYGKTFLKLDNGFNRLDSVKDIGALLDWIAKQPDLDAERVMVTGGSYGGYMTLAVATMYNDRIRCSLDVVGISNFVTFLERTESYRRDLRRVEYGDEREPAMREFMNKTAPVNNAKNITRPLFVVQGKNDPRVPINEAEQMVKTVRENGSPVWYLVGKDEGHGFAKKKNVDYQFFATIMFIRQYLVG
jgi:dipeptidyl aminopeptidase/acylaminoacyl peptidase